MGLSYHTDLKGYDKSIIELVITQISGQKGSAPLV
jgi:hypothetical protein